METIPYSEYTLLYNYEPKLFITMPSLPHDTLTASSGRNRTISYSVISNIDTFFFIGVPLLVSSGISIYIKQTI